MPLTHINDQGRARMVDVSEKAITHRIAVAAGSIYMQPETLQAIIAVSYTHLTLPTS